MRDPIYIYCISGRKKSAGQCRARSGEPRSLRMRYIRRAREERRAGIYSYIHITGPKIERLRLSSLSASYLLPLEKEEKKRRQASFFLRRSRCGLYLYTSLSSFFKNVKRRERERRSESRTGNRQFSVKFNIGVIAGPYVIELRQPIWLISVECFFFLAKKVVHLYIYYSFFSDASIIIRPIIPQKWQRKKKSCKTRAIHTRTRED